MHAAKGADADVNHVVRTQNAFTFDVNARTGSRLLVNTTNDAGWRTSVGTLSNQDKELVLDVPPGAAYVRVWYWPVRLTLGIWLTLGTLVGLVVFFVRGRGRRRAPRFSASAGSPSTSRPRSTSAS